MKTHKLNWTNKPGKEFFGTTAPVFIEKRWKLLPLAVFALIVSSCTNNDQLVQQYKTLHEHDSALMVKSATEDTTITGYIHNLNDIQSNLDNIKAREKILTVQGQNESKPGNTAVQDIKAIDNLIIKNNREIAALHLRMKKMNGKNEELETMVARMTAEIAQQDTEIAVLKNSLARSNESYNEVTRQFNDSITVIKNQNARIQNMTTVMNTVYYAVGTERELKKKRVITTTGGFIGLGQNSELTPDNNTAYFTKTDLTKLNVIPLNAKFRKLLTTHPAESYKITGNKVVDSLVITDKPAFWSEDKYLVIAVR